jgi:hypothetical protein
MLIRAGFEPFRASGIVARPKLPKSGATTNGFGISLGKATPTARLKTGAGSVKQLTASWARRVCRPTGRTAVSPIRPIAHSPFHIDLAVNSPTVSPVLHLKNVF